MGSPLSPVLANIYMEYFEEIALGSPSLKPSIWLRYVDDTFILWPHQENQVNSKKKKIEQREKMQKQKRERAKQKKKKKKKKEKKEKKKADNQKEAEKKKKQKCY